MFHVFQQRPVGLYVHLPWCIRKCPYCDFNSHRLNSTLPEQAYVNALLEDWHQQRHWLQGRAIGSIFLGGGTPSLFSGQAIAALIAEIKSTAPCVDPLEITLEANPGTTEQAKFEAYRAGGVNRLSLGIQSFSADKLEQLGRIHSVDNALTAITQAKQAGFDNFNLDLMYGLPQQTIEQAANDLQQALAANPSHLSWYQLTLEPNTYFAKYPPTLPTEDTLIAIEENGLALLDQAGLARYEISAYAHAENKRCQHNLTYWQFGDYLGLGAGAHSKITDFTRQQIWRFVNHKLPTSYLNPALPYQAKKQPITKADLGFEYMLNALRLNQPIDLTEFEITTGLGTEEIAQPIALAVEKGFIESNKTQIIKTPVGHQFLNDLQALFLRS